MRFAVLRLGRRRVTGPPIPPPLPGRWGGSGDVPARAALPETSQRSAPPSAIAGLRMAAPAEAAGLPAAGFRRCCATSFLPQRSQGPRGDDQLDPSCRPLPRSVRKTLERHGLPKDLFYAAMVESGFDTSSRSRVGAGRHLAVHARRGPRLRAGGQLLGGRTARSRAQRRGRRPVPEGPLRSLRLLAPGVRRVNAGYGAVLSSITRTTPTTTGSCAGTSRGCPGSRSIDVPNVLAAAIVGHNLECSGSPTSPPIRRSPSISVEGRRGPWWPRSRAPPGPGPRTSTALNPQLVRDRTPPDCGVSPVHSRTGRPRFYAEAAGALARRRRSAGQAWCFRFGETIDDIAKRAWDRAARAAQAERRQGQRRAARRRHRGRPEARRAGPQGAGRTRTGDAGKGGARPERRGRGRASRGDRAGPDDDRPSSPSPTGSSATRGASGSSTGRVTATPSTRLPEDFGVRRRRSDGVEQPGPGGKLQPRLVLQFFVRKDFDPAASCCWTPIAVRVVTLGSDEFLELETARRGKKRLFLRRQGGRHAGQGRPSLWPDAG